MQAVINAFDEGTRLRPLSCSKNPFLLTVGNKTIIEHIVDNLKYHDVKNIVIFTGYMSEGLYEKLQDKEINVEYRSGMLSDGALKIHQGILEKEFLYFSRPVYTNVNYTKLIDFHIRHGAYATCVTEKGITDGLVRDKKGAVTKIGESRLWDRMSPGQKGLGIYLLNRDIVNFIPEETNVELGENILQSLIRSGKSIYAYNAPSGEAVWDTASYMRINNMYLDSIPQGIEISVGAVVEKGALLEKPCFIGSNAHIHKGAKIGSGTVIGRNTTVLEGSCIKRSIVGEGCRIEKNAGLRGCIVDDSARIEEGASIYEQAIIGFGSKIGKNSLVRSFVKVWPEKFIPEKVTVSENIMWGQRKRASLFEEGEIKGVVNVDITPSFATKVGSVLGFVMGLGEVGVSTDGSASAQMLREGIVAGLMGQGITVKDFGEQPLPITRRAVMFYMLKGAIVIGTFEKDGEDWAEITLIGKDGVDIDEKTRLRLEELYEEGGFIYPESRSIKETRYHFEYKLYYLKSLMEKGGNKNMPMKILLSCPAPWGRRLVVSAMSDFATNVSMYRGADKDIKGFEIAVDEGDFDMGFITDSTCQKLTVVLPDWGAIDENVYEVMCSLIIMLKYKNPEIFVPVTASGAVEELAKRYGGSVIRTKCASGEIMRHLSGSKEYLSEQFVYRYDAVGAIIKLVEFMTERTIRPESLLDKIPSVSMAKTKVALSSDEIERALKRINELQGESTRSPEGVKITFDKGWVVVIPDAYKEVCHVVSEGNSAEFAKELCDFCVEKMMEK